MGKNHAAPVPYDSVQCNSDIDYFNHEVATAVLITFYRQFPPSEVSIGIRYNRADLEKFYFPIEVAAVSRSIGTQLLLYQVLLYCCNCPLAGKSG